MVNEKKAQKQTKKMEMKLRGIKVSENKDKLKDELKREKKQEKIKHPLKLLFDLSNIKDMVKCCLKHRPNRVRTQIWLIFGAMIIIITSHNGQSLIL
jgi:hypothetical protein